MASRYTAEIAGELAGKPFDRAFLDRFAAIVKDRGKVVELGCGPAHVAAYLADRGVDISGLDLSPGMVAEAGQLFPGLEVVVGDMLALPYADATLAGVVSFYSIVHFDDQQLAIAFAEMARVLDDGGVLALAFHIGDEVVHRDQWWDMPVVLDFRFLDPVQIKDKLLKSGFDIESDEERAPYADVEYQSQRAYIVANRLPRE